MAALDVVDLIVRKRDGGTLESGQIRSLVAAYTAGSVPDYQMSAFLMAAFLRGLNDEETLGLAEAMIKSGITVDLSEVPGTKVDKHSTGGVGDKISLVLAPTVAACGVPVPMISGRSLGFTGGTLDKLESITGFRTDLSTDEYKRMLREHGLVLIGQTADIAPADRLLYALRDVTGTVEFIPFIASSIMSKKLAEGTDALVLDVKCGRGAFMKEESQARKLAETLVGIGERFDTTTVAHLTRMDEPLGYCVGNWPEVVESVACLRGESIPQVSELTLALAGEMIFLGRKASSREEGTRLAEEAITSGRAFDKFVEIVRAQSGDVSLLENPDGREGYAPVVEVAAEDDGYVGRVDALEIGHTATVMGAGRMQKEDRVDPLAGMVLLKKHGDPVRRGEVLARLYTSRTDRLEHFAQRVRNAFRIQSEQPAPAGSVLIDRFENGNWSMSESRTSV